MINGNTLVEVPILKIVEDVQKLDELTILKQLQELPKLKQFEERVLELKNKMMDDSLGVFKSLLEVQLGLKKKKKGELTFEKFITDGEYSGNKFLFSPDLNFFYHKEITLIDLSLFYSTKQKKILDGFVLNDSVRVLRLGKFLSTKMGIKSSLAKEVYKIWLGLSPDFSGFYSVLVSELEKEILKLSKKWVTESLGKQDVKYVFLHNKKYTFSPVKIETTFPLSFCNNSSIEEFVRDSYSGRELQLVIDFIEKPDELKEEFNLDDSEIERVQNIIKKVSRNVYFEGSDLLEELFGQSEHTLLWLDQTNNHYLLNKIKFLKTFKSKFPYTDQHIDKIFEGGRFSINSLLSNSGRYCDVFGKGKEIQPKNNFGLYQFLLENKEKYPQINTSLDEYIEKGNIILDIKEFKGDFTKIPDLYKFTLNQLGYINLSIDSLWGESYRHSQNQEKLTTSEIVSVLKSVPATIEGLPVHFFVKDESEKSIQKLLQFLNFIETDDKSSLLYQIQERGEECIGEEVRYKYIHPTENKSTIICKLEETPVLWSLN
jgi:hypothetical protein